MPRLAIGLCALLLTAPALAVDSQGAGRDALGIRAGLGLEPDQFYVGGQAELGPILGPAFFLPGVDIGFGDGDNVTLLNGDFRWYLLPLPGTGVHIYGSAGPTVVVSPETDLGLSLAVGIDIPMRGKNRYNLEARFGVGDIPDLRLMFGVLFGL